MLGAVEGKLIVTTRWASKSSRRSAAQMLAAIPRRHTLSRDSKWIVNGATTGATMHYTILRRADRACMRRLQRAGYTGGDLPIDPAPCWNREETGSHFQPWRKMVLTDVRCACAKGNDGG